MVHAPNQSQGCLHIFIQAGTGVKGLVIVHGDMFPGPASHPSLVKAGVVQNKAVLTSNLAGGGGLGLAGGGGLGLTGGGGLGLTGGGGLGLTGGGEDATGGGLKGGGLAAATTGGGLQHKL